MTTVGRQPIERFGPKWAPSPFERGTDGPRVIVVGIDGSDSSMRAAAYACGLARRQQSQLVVAYAVPMPTWAWMAGGSAAGAIQSTIDELTMSLRAEVQQLAEDAQVPVTFVNRPGDAYICLRSVADELKADTVVVGAPEQRRHRIAGSIGARLMRLNRWPITIVP